jgi:hypothetical protein
MNIDYLPMKDPGKKGSEKKLKRKYPGGRRPIYVESKDDPRYVAYQDSLALHNASEIGRRGAEVFENTPFPNETTREFHHINPDTKYSKTKHDNVTRYKFADDEAPNQRDISDINKMTEILKGVSFPTSIRYGDSPDITIDNQSDVSRFNPIGSYLQDGGYANPSYKKPEQEVKLKTNSPLESVNKTSLVDLMKERGLDSSFDSRKKLYESSGLPGEFKGTKEQGDVLTKMSGGNESGFGELWYTDEFMDETGTMQLAGDRNNLEPRMTKTITKMNNVSQYPNGMNGTKDDGYNKFVNSLPDNLKHTDTSTYNLRGYWDALGRPDTFDYSQPKEKDGYHHAFSRHPRTGEILKKTNHPSFRQAIDGDIKAGYMPYIKDSTVYTFDKNPGEGYTPYMPKTHESMNNPNRHRTPTYPDGRAKTQEFDGGLISGPLLAKMLGAKAGAGGAVDPKLVGQTAQQLNPMNKIAGGLGVMGDVAGLWAATQGDEKAAKYAQLFKTMGGTAGVIGDAGNKNMSKATDALAKSTVKTPNFTGDPSKDMYKGTTDNFYSQYGYQPGEMLSRYGMNYRKK